MANYNAGQKQSQIDFGIRLISLQNQFLFYESSGNKLKASEYVPYRDLKSVAEAKYLSMTGKESFTEDEEDEIRDIFIVDLLNWFKDEFFSWVDIPNCQRCSKETSPIGNDRPTGNESLRSATRVELFKCSDPSCGHLTRFPRFNNPVMLLETRKGRCGEWANCFALISRACGYEVRHVTDWTDHVWVEIFSNAQDRWIHVDPCEKSFDNPLLYEVGWGKKLSYVIAVTQDDIQDVTWRYTKDPKAILSRRTLCDESWLVRQLLIKRAERQISLDPFRIKVLDKRLAKELAEFICPKRVEAKEGEKQGRESGSIAWRLARQELGEEPTLSSYVGSAWKLNNEDVIDGKFVLAYDSIKDEYSMNGKIKASGWEHGILASENIFRKVENDWKMVYLARKDNKVKEGTIKWGVHLSQSTAERYSIESLQVLMSTSSFHESAIISVSVAGDADNKYHKIPKSFIEGESFNWRSLGTKEEGIRGSKGVTILCRLSGGDGDNAWQQAQLFRRKLNQEANHPQPFQVIVTLKEIQNSSS